MKKGLFFVFLLYLLGTAASYSQGKEIKSSSDIRKHTEKNEKKWKKYAENTLGISLDEYSLVFYRNLNGEGGHYENGTIHINMRGAFDYLEYNHTTSYKYPVDANIEDLMTVRGGFFHELGHFYLEQKVKEMLKNNLLYPGHEDSWNLVNDLRASIDCLSNLHVSFDNPKSYRGVTLDSVECYMDMRTWNVLNEGIACYFQDRLTGYDVEVDIWREDFAHDWDTVFSNIISKEKFAFNEESYQMSEYRMKYNLSSFIMGEIFDNLGVEEGIEKILSEPFMSITEFKKPKEYVERIIK